MNTNKVREWQLGTILRYIYHNPGISRVGLMKALNLGKSAVAQITATLLESGWIRDGGTQTKELPLYINESKTVVAGVDILKSQQNIVLCNLNGDILYQQELSHSLRDPVSFIEGPLSEILLSLSKDYPIGLAGLALPGPFDPSSNKLLASRIFPLEEPLYIPQQIDGWPGRLYSDYNIHCCAYGIKAFHKESEDFLLVYSSDGDENPERVLIGSTFFFDEEPVLGVNSLAGEIFSTYENKQNLSDVFSIPLSDMKKLQHDRSIVSQIFDEISLHVGFLVNYLDTGKLYLAGEARGIKGLLDKNIKIRTLENCVYPRLQKFDLITSPINDNSLAQGAAAMAIEKLFSKPDFSKENSFYQALLTGNGEIV